MYMLRAKYCNSLLQQVRIDGTDLHIIRLLARDSRTPYKRGDLHHYGMVGIR